MHWTPQGRDTILALRTAVLNGEFDQRWQITRGLFDYLLFFPTHLGHVEHNIVIPWTRRFV